MAPQQDPLNIPESEKLPEIADDFSSAAPVESPPIVASTEELAGVDTSLDVDSNGFVAEPAIEAVDTPVPVDNHESFQAQLAPVVPPKKSKKKLLLIVAASAVAVLLTSGSVFAFWYNAPDKSVTDALGRMLSVSSLKADGTLTIDNTSTTTPDLKLSYALGANESSMSADADLDIIMDSKTTLIKTNLVVTEDAVAIKLANFRTLLESFMGAAYGTDALALYDGLINKIDNKWVVITKEDLNQISQEDNTDAQTTCAQNALKTFQTSSTQKKEVSTVYEDNQFIIVSKSLGTETINGKLSNRYELTVDNKKAQAFAEKLTTTTVFKAVDTCYEGALTTQYQKTVKDPISETDSKATGKVELWVDVLSHDPTKIKLTATDPETTVTLESNLHLNAAPQITVPKAGTTLKDLQDEVIKLQQTMYGGLEDSIDTSVLGIRTII